MTRKILAHTFLKCSNKKKKKFQSRALELSLFKPIYQNHLLNSSIPLHLFTFHSYLSTSATLLAHLYSEQIITSLYISLHQLNPLSLHLHLSMSAWLALTPFLFSLSLFPRVFLRISPHHLRDAECWAHKFCSVWNRRWLPRTAGRFFITGALFSAVCCHHRHVTKPNDRLRVYVCVFETCRSLRKIEANSGG